MTAVLLVSRVAMRIVPNRSLQALASTTLVSSDAYLVDVTFGYM